MATEFDYTATDTPDDVVRSVVAEISGAGLKPLSAEEWLERNARHERQAFLSEQRREERRIERERREAEAAETARAIAAAALAEANRKRRLEREQEISRQVRDREIRDLRFQTEQNRAWQNNVTSSFRQTLANRQLQTTIAEMDAIVNSPSPLDEPEPEPEYPEKPKIGDPDFYEKWNARWPLRSWYNFD